MISVYGIKQCDTCRKAMKWLADQGIEATFHDLRVNGVDAERLKDWLGSPFADQLVNRRSTTWRTLSDEEKATSGASLVNLLLAHPTLIKRPVFLRGDRVIAVGFTPDTLTQQVR